MLEDLARFAKKHSLFYRNHYSQPTVPDLPISAIFRAARRRICHNGKLDVLVNYISGGDELTERGVPFWEHSLENELTMMERAINTHIITSHFAAPLLIKPLLQLCAVLLLMYPSYAYSCYAAARTRLAHRRSRSGS